MDNIYWIEKDVVRYTLLPLKRDTQPKTSKVEGKAFLTVVNTCKEFIVGRNESRNLLGIDISTSKSNSSTSSLT